MKKVLCAFLALALTTTAFAQKDDGDGGGFKLGFYGTLAGSNGSLAAITSNESGFALGPVGVLFNLGNGLEIGLGLSVAKYSATEEISAPGVSNKTESSAMVWEMIPGISYEIGKGDLIRYGAGLDIHLSSWSSDYTAAGTTVTTEPANMDMAFFPNFYVSAEVVKNFNIGLRTGIMVYMPGDEEEEEYGVKQTTKTSAILTRTELFASFYLF